MIKRINKRFAAVMLCANMLLAAGCGTGEPANENYMTEIQIGPEDVENNKESGNNAATNEEGNVREEPEYTSEKLSGEDTSGPAENAGATEVPEDMRPITEFGVTLLQNTLKNSDSDKNVLVSPLSVLMALAMTSNGAEGETKAQMEAVLGENLNAYLSSYRLNLPSDEKSSLHLANAIWFKDMELLQVKEEFLKANADYYDAAIYKAPFDATTLQDINNWVEYHTDGMIKNILDKISEDAALYLVNALSFDAEWSSVYYENQIREGIFTKEDGTAQQAEMMYSEEHRYLEDEWATGFMKYYRGQKYAFVALLPKEGITVADYVESLTGEHLKELLEVQEYQTVDVMMPKFETEYSIELNDVLKQMGMVNAFDRDIADFSAMATVPPDWNISISRVLHKTFITVDERGTKAGAATVVQMDCTTTSIDVELPKQVFLDRPFVYLLIDCEKNEPFFMGTMMDMEK